MAYCVSADLLLGEIGTRLPPEINVTQYINTVADEIDARLGFTYQIPFETTGLNALPPAQVKLLKSINAKRATGRIVMAVTIAAEDNLVHQYGLRLLQEADLELAAIANGDIRLSAPLVDSEGIPTGPIDDPDIADPYARIPGGTVIDAYSANAAFESHVMQGQPTVWSPRDGTREYPLPYPRRAGG